MSSAKCVKCGRTGEYYRRLGGFCFHWACALGFLPPARYGSMMRGVSSDVVRSSSVAKIEKVCIPICEFEERAVYLSPVRSFYIGCSEGMDCIEAGYYKVEKGYVVEKLVNMSIPVKAYFDMRMVRTEPNEKKLELPYYEVDYREDIGKNILERFEGNIVELSKSLYERGILNRKSPVFLGEFYSVVKFEMRMLDPILWRYNDEIIKSLIFRKIKMKINDIDKDFIFAVARSEKFDSGYYYLVVEKSYSKHNGQPFKVYIVKRAFKKSLLSGKKRLSFQIIFEEKARPKELRRVLRQVIEKSVFKENLALKLTDRELVLDPTKKQIAVLRSKSSIINFRYLHTFLQSERELKKFIKYQLYSDKKVEDLTGPASLSRYGLAPVKSRKKSVTVKSKKTIF